MARSAGESVSPRAAAASVTRFSKRRRKPRCAGPTIVSGSFRAQAVKPPIRPQVRNRANSSIAPHDGGRAPLRSIDATGSVLFSPEPTEHLPFAIPLATAILAGEIDADGHVRES